MFQTRIKITLDLLNNGNLLFKLYYLKKKKILNKNDKFNLAYTYNNDLNFRELILLYASILHLKGYIRFIEIK